MFTLSSGFLIFTSGKVSAEVNDLKKETVSGIDIGYNNYLSHQENDSFIIIDVNLEKSYLFKQSFNFYAFPNNHSLFISTYTVKAGDTLFKIAAANKVSLSKLIAINKHIKNPDLIYPGDKIFFPRNSRDYTAFTSEIKAGKLNRNHVSSVINFQSTVYPSFANGLELEPWMFQEHIRLNFDNSKKELNLNQSSENLVNNIPETNQKQQSENSINLESDVISQEQRSENSINLESDVISLDLPINSKDFHNLDKNVVNISSENVQTESETEKSEDKVSNNAETHIDFVRRNRWLNPKKVDSLAYFKGLELNVGLPKRNVANDLFQKEIYRIETAAGSVKISQYELGSDSSEDSLGFTEVLQPHNHLVPFSKLSLQSILTPPRKIKEERISITYLWPTTGIVTSKFNDLRPGGRRHKGVDIANAVGTPIYAAAAGKVIFSGWNAYGYGNLVILQHANGDWTLYAHNVRNRVTAGQHVIQGQWIADMGSTGFSTGSHLHFEIRKNLHGILVHVNPEKLLLTKNITKNKDNLSLKQ